MHMRRAIWTCLLGCLCVPQIHADAFEPPLFPVDAPAMKVTITAPWRDLVSKRKRRPEFPATVSYTSGDGESVSVPATITTRGRSRLEHCDFPPLRLDFKKKAAADTVFAGQKKLKLVTQCKRSNKYADYLKAEFILYRVFNLLTDYSFRVRMLEIDYEYDSGSRYRDAQIGFFLEDKRSVTARTQLDEIKIKTLKPDRLNAADLGRYALFQYFIGNTDWAVLASRGDEDCCHNGILLGEANSESGWIPVPYDFDQAGIINVEYALPAVGLPIRSVRTRFYRGFCVSNDILDDTIAEFAAIKPQLLELFETAGLRGRTQSRAVGYIEDFFEIVNDPARVEKELRAKCRMGPQ